MHVSTQSGEPQKSDVMRDAQRGLKRRAATQGPRHEIVLERSMEDEVQNDQHDHRNTEKPAK